MSKAYRLLKHLVILIPLMLIMGFVCYFDSLELADKAFQDYIHTITPPTRSENIYIIGIDNNTLEEIGPWGTWSRGVMGELIDKLTSDPKNSPAVIGIDVMYFGNKEEDSQGDSYLVEAVKKAGNVVVANEVIFGKEANENGTFDYYVVDKIEEPYQKLKEVTRQGFVNTIPDIADGKIRKSLDRVFYKAKQYNSFASEIYRFYVERQGKGILNEPKLNKYNQWDIEFAEGDYGDYSLAKVLSGEIPVSEFKDAIVIVGPYSSGMQDEHYTPGRSNKLFGVEIHANVLQCLLENRFKQEVSRAGQTIFLLVLMLVLYICFILINIRISTGLFFLSLTATLISPHLIYQKGFVVSVIYSVLSVILIYMACLIINYIAEIFRRKRITDSFKKYVAPQVVEILVKGEEQELKLGGNKRNIAVLFIDIRGFTSMAEKLKPEETVDILNEYFNLSATAIFKFGGTLDKFIGDSVMAIFNAPLSLDDYVYAAICAAMEIIKGSDELNDIIEKKYGIRVNFGIGINCGHTVVGNIGTSFRMEYTAIGDTVNIAARLEEKARPGQILISQDVYSEVMGRIKVTPIGEMALKGKSKSVYVYQLDGVKFE